MHRRVASPNLNSPTTVKTLIPTCVLAAIWVATPITATAEQPFALSHEVPLVNQVILGSLTPAADKLIQLAQAIPESKYEWTPGEGVATVRDVIAHVTGANYYVSSMLGATLPEGIHPQDIGKGKNKAELIAAYQESVVFARAAVAKITAEEMAEEIDFWGNRAPRAQLAMIIVDHNHEHLGQLIAYARSNSVVPPWSRKSD